MNIRKNILPLFLTAITLVTANKANSFGYDYIELVRKNINTSSIGFSYVNHTRAGKAMYDTGKLGSFDACFGFKTNKCKATSEYLIKTTAAHACQEVVKDFGMKMIKPAGFYSGLASKRQPILGVPPKNFPAFKCWGGFYTKIKEICQIREDIGDEMNVPHCN